nr:16S rRNA (cytosine(1402)-N(4))-methyltransferase RsmH [Maliibacterium massiliense]
MDFAHVSVMLDACIQALACKSGGFYVDGTLGGGGHSEAILRASAPDGRLIGIDRDDDALKSAGVRLAPYGARVCLCKGNFADMAQLVSEVGWGLADGILLDLGVSSYQLDEAARGFSYQHDAPLDMRMDRTRDFRAYDVVNGYTQQQLQDVIRNYGEERWASRIAQFIVARRGQAPIATTQDLVDVIKAAIPSGARREGPHPAKRTFQAIRIEVNDELGSIQRLLEGITAIMKPGARIAIITFHSLEDRLVKQGFKHLEHPCTCPREAPVCTCGKTPQLRIITRKPILPDTEELASNPRARSAKLRVAQKI